MLGVERDYVKYEFCAARGGAFDPKYDKGEQRYPCPGPKLTLEATGGALC